jgi:hypothetical protein
VGRQEDAIDGLLIWKLNVERLGDLGRDVYRSDLSAAVGDLSDSAIRRLLVAPATGS